MATYDVIRIIERRPILLTGQQRTDMLKSEGVEHGLPGGWESATHILVFSDGKKTAHRL